VSFSNCYQDQARADAYATLEFKNTYYLAYRDLPAIAREHVQGSEALDFGCGTGRSTRFLQQLGFQVISVDISEDISRKIRILARLLNSTGRIIHVVSRPEIYIHEWASFSTQDFPENRTAHTGDTVRIIVTDHADRRPVEDILWTATPMLTYFTNPACECLRNTNL